MLADIAKSILKQPFRRLLMVITRNLELELTQAVIMSSTHNLYLSMLGV